VIGYFTSMIVADLRNRWSALESCACTLQVLATHHLPADDVCGRPLTIASTHETMLNADLACSATGMVPSFWRSRAGGLGQSRRRITAAIAKHEVSPDVEWWQGRNVPTHPGTVVVVGVYTVTCVDTLARPRTSTLHGRGSKMTTAVSVERRAA
jgi:hypothetical protein